MFLSRKTTNKKVRTGKEESVIENERRVAVPRTSSLSSPAKQRRMRTTTTFRASSSFDLDLASSRNNRGSRSDPGSFLKTRRRSSFSMTLGKGSNCSEDNSMSRFMSKSDDSLPLHPSNNHRNDNDKPLEMATLRFDKNKKLYGRDDEIRILRDAFKQRSQRRQHQKTTATTTGNEVVVLVAGESGAGKTSLVNAALRDVVERAGGTYAVGKYDGHRRAPYAGVAAACEAICRRLSSVRADDCERIRNRLRKELGGSAVHALAEVFPSLLELIGTDGRNSEDAETAVGEKEPNHHYHHHHHLGHHHLGHHRLQQQSSYASSVQNRIKEAQQRFLLAFGRFIRIVTSYCPVVLMLDDLQWADSESLTLLEYLVRYGDANDDGDEENDDDDAGNDIHKKGFLLVGCYRSDEVVDEAHILSKWIRDLDCLVSTTNNDGITTTTTTTTTKSIFTHISLQGLDVRSVNEMIVDLLSSDAECTEDLALTVHKKTHGNAFYVVQYLKLLYERGILEFNVGLMKWVWSVQEIESKTAATENVVDLLRKKMEHLPEDLREFLSLAACLGSTFTSRMLSVVRHGYRSGGPKIAEKLTTAEGNHSAATIMILLERCTQEGFIKRIDEQCFSWVHAKIQEAALGLIAANQVENVQFAVGEILLQTLSPEEIKNDVFVIANLVNLCTETESMPDSKRRILARLNLEAGRSAISASSFVTGAEYLQAGIKVLPQNHWQDDYELSLNLFSTAAEAEFCTGDVQSLERHCQAIIEQDDRPIADKFRAYNVLYVSLGNRNRVSEACDMIVDILEKIGCRFVKKGQLFHWFYGIMRTKSAMKRYNPEDLINFREMTDKIHVQTMRLLDSLTTFTYFWNGSSLLLPLSILKSFRYCQEYGVCEFSPPAFARMAKLLIVKLRDFEGGRKYAEFALKMVSNLEFEYVESRTVFLTYAFTLHQCIPHQLCLKPLLHGYETGLATGDVESAIWSIYMYLEYSYYGGKSLRAMDNDFEAYTRQMKSMKQLVAHEFSLYERQVIQNLLGLNADPCKLQGDVFDVEKTNTDRYLCSMIRARQLDLALFMGNDEVGAEIGYKLKKEYAPDELSPGTCGTDMLELNVGVLCFGAMRKTKKKMYMATAKASHRYIKEAVKKGNPNLVNSLCLLDAELAALRGRKEVARKHFEDSILYAARKGAINYQAIASERFGDYMAECGDKDEAIYRLEKAIHLYAEWGAVVKVESLTQKVSLLRSGAELV